MIYEDVHNFLMYQASSKEVDVILNLLSNTDWNNNVEINTYDLAKNTGTTNKYVKDILKKLNSNVKRKKVLKEIRNDGLFVEYKMLLGKSSILYSKSDRYGRKFSFLYSEEFQGLSIYAKRIILDVVMKVSITQQNNIYIDTDRYLSPSELTSGLIPNKSLLIEAVSEINNKFGLFAKANLTKLSETKKEYVLITIGEHHLEHTLINNTEESALKRALFKYGYFGQLSSDQLIELLKVGSYIFNSIFELTRSAVEKFNSTTDLFEMAFDLAREVYNKSLEKLVRQLPNNFELKEPTELSAYFSSIAFETITELSVKFKTNLETKLHLINNHNSKHKEKGMSTLSENDLGENYIVEKTFFIILDNWRHNWLKPRLNKKDAKRFQENESALNHIENFKQFLTNTTEILKERASRKISGLPIKNKILTFIESYRDDPMVLLEINEERLIEKHSLIAGA